MLKKQQVKALDRIIRRAEKIVLDQEELLNTVLELDVDDNELEKDLDDAIAAMLRVIDRLEDAAVASASSEEAPTAEKLRRRELRFGHKNPAADLDALMRRRGK